MNTKSKGKQGQVHEGRMDVWEWERARLVRNRSRLDYAPRLPNLSTGESHGAGSTDEVKREAIARRSLTSNIPTSRRRPFVSTTCNTATWRRNGIASSFGDRSRKSTDATSERARTSRLN